MKLHEYNQEIEKVLNSLVIDEKTGEVTGYEAVEKVQTDFDDKLESMVCFYKDLQAEIVAFKAEEQNLKVRRESLEKRSESLKNYITACMVDAEKDKFSSAKCKVSFKASQETVVDDESLIPKEFLNIKTVTKSTPDKTKIKEAITKHGLMVPGAHVVDKQNIQIK